MRSSEETTPDIVTETGERENGGDWSRVHKGCFACCIAGAMRRSGPGARSRGSHLPSKPAAMASGWPAGWGRAGLVRVTGWLGREVAGRLT
jgi:hypothetical protein